MKKEVMIEKINLLKVSGNEEWNHQFSFPGKVKTRSHDINSPGYNINKWERLKPIIENMCPQGKTFLDVGCSDGFYSIEIAKLGAEHVLGSDLDELRIKRALLAKDILDIKNVDFEVLDLYNIPNDKSYDVVVGLGLLHRIPDMNECLNKMSNIAKSIIVEFKTCKSELSTYIDHGGKSKSNIYNGLYVTPSIQYVKETLSSLGFTKFVVYEDEKSHLNYPRTIIVASKDW